MSKYQLPDIWKNSIKISVQCAELFCQTWFVSYDSPAIISVSGFSSCNLSVVICSLSENGNWTKFNTKIMFFVDGSISAEKWEFTLWAHFTEGVIFFYHLILGESQHRLVSDLLGQVCIVHFFIFSLKYLMWPIYLTWTLQWLQTS